MINNNKIYGEIELIKKFFASLVTFFIIAMPACAYDYSKNPIENTKDSFYHLVNFINPKPIPHVAHQTIGVIPVDVHITGDTQSIYTSTLSLISEDISNRLNKSQKLTSLSLKKIEDKIKANNLTKEFNDFLTLYKNRYIIDYEALQKIASALNIDKILLVSGDFDTRQFLLKPNLAYALDIPETSVLKPSYRAQTTTTFIDPFSQIVLWDKEFSKDFKISNFDVPAIKFANNVIPISEIKKFSKEISPQVTRQIFYSLPISRIQSVKSSVITTQNQIKDGVTTTEGHSYSTNTKTLEQKRKQKYTEWVNENL